jgi:hypothetical protein
VYDALIDEKKQRDFMLDLHFPHRGALKYWHVIPTKASLSCRAFYNNVLKLLEDGISGLERQ